MTNPPPPPTKILPDKNFSSAKLFSRRYIFYPSKKLTPKSNPNPKPNPNPNPKNFYKISLINLKYFGHKILETKLKNTTIDDIDTEIIAMHYGIVWGGETKSIPTRLPIDLVGILFVFPPYNTIMHCDNFSIDIVYLMIQIQCNVYLETQIVYVVSLLERYFCCLISTHLNRGRKGVNCWDFAL